MELVRATEEDIDSILTLLSEVHAVHANQRPDLFKKGARKHERKDIIAIMQDEDTPIYVYRVNGKAIAHAFIEYKWDTRGPAPIKTMFIDDICVLSAARGRGIGKKLMHDLETLARENDCYRITLNVYNFNDAAMHLYTSCDMSPLSTTLEKVL